MAKGMYAVVGNSTKKVKTAYCVVGGVTKKLKAVYAVVDGKTRLIWDGGSMDPMFVGVGRYGSYTSKDGITWSRTYFSSGTIGGNTPTLAAGNGVYVMLGPKGTIGYSTDGLTWTMQTLSISGYKFINAVGYGNTNSRVSFCNGKFIAIVSGYTTSNDAATLVLTSVDGKTWTNVGTIAKNYADFATNMVSNIVYANYKGTMYYFIVLSGYDNDVAGGRTKHSLWYSSNLTSWTKISNTGAAKYLYAVDKLYSINDTLYCTAGYCFYDGSDDEFRPPRVYYFDSSWQFVPGATDTSADYRYKYINGSTYNYDTGEFALVISYYGTTQVGTGSRFIVSTNKTQSMTMKSSYIPMPTNGRCIYALAYGAGKYTAISVTANPSISSAEKNGVSYSTDGGSTWTVLSGMFYQEYPIDDMSSKNYDYFRG